MPVSLLLMLPLPESPSFKLEAPPHQRVRLADLFGKEVVRDTVALWCAFFACLLAIYSVFSWAPTMLSDARFALVAANDGLSAFNLGGIGGVVVVAMSVTFAALASLSRHVPRSTDP